MICVWQPTLFFGEASPISADIRDHIHWLPIRSRINVKRGLVYKCLHGNAPLFLIEMLQPALRRLQSTALGDLVVPRTLTRSIRPRSFSVSGAAFWNTLPDHLRDHSLSIAILKKKLKSFSFLQLM